jgi:hypothetical protein
MTSSSGYQSWPIVGAIVRWWRNRFADASELFELERYGAQELEHMARDLGLSTADLRMFMTHTPGDANLLRCRVASLRLDPDELAWSEPALVRDMQRLCTLCKAQARCARDFGRIAADPAWQNWREYCPNATALTMLSTIEDCSRSVPPQTRSPYWA